MFPGHDDTLRELDRRLDVLGVPHEIDHLENEDSPDRINDRRPDAFIDRPGRRDVVVEVDSSADPSTRDREQLRDIAEGMDPFDELVRISPDGVETEDDLSWL